MTRRDIQQKLVYAWERKAYPGYWAKERSLDTPEVRALVRRVHADVLSRGGYAHVDPIVKFTKRNGSACASWGVLKFTPGRCAPELVLHEIAHSLTWHFMASREAARSNDPDPFMQHARDIFCTQGHGPRYVACFIALCEKYAGRPADAALTLAQSFEYETLGPWRVIRQQSNAYGWPSTQTHRTREYVTKRASVRVDAKALTYWRMLFA